MVNPENPPAFPQQCADALDVGMVRAGMSLRDHFAGLALVGMGAWAPCDEHGFAQPDQAAVWKAKAEWAYGMADAMLNQREASDGSR